MKKMIVAVSFLLAGGACYLALSFYFFPLPFSAAEAAYFTEAMRHMMPVKLLIALIVALIFAFAADFKMQQTAGSE